MHDIFHFRILPYKIQDYTKVIKQFNDNLSYSAHDKNNSHIGQTAKQHKYQKLASYMMMCIMFVRLLN